MSKTIYNKPLFTFGLITGQTNYTTYSQDISKNLNNVFCAGFVVLYQDIYNSLNIQPQFYTRNQLFPFTGNNILEAQSLFINPLGYDNTLHFMSKDLSVPFDNLKVPQGSYGDWLPNCNEELYDIILPVVPTANDIYCIVSAVLYKLPNKITYKFKSNN